MNEHEDGLLEYLEDIIGTTKYKQPIEDAQLEVDALSEERGEKMNRLRMVEREKSSLEVCWIIFSSSIGDDTLLGKEKRSRGLLARHQRSNEKEIPALAIPSIYFGKQYRANVKGYCG